jgi:ABC-type tungstate transport system substrate-binding protein
MTGPTDILPLFVLLLLLYILIARADHIGSFLLFATWLILIGHGADQNEVGLSACNL